LFIFVKDTGFDAQLHYHTLITDMTSE